MATQREGGQSLADLGAGEILAEAVRALAEASTEPAGALGKVVELVASALDCFCVISLPNAAGTHLEPGAHYERDTARGEARRALAAATPAPVDSDLAAARVFRSGEALTLDPPDDAFLRARFPDPEQFERARALGAGAILITPLRVRGVCLGILTLVRSQPGSFTDEERRLATLLAQHAALGIHNAKLVNDLQRALQVSEATQRELASSEARLRQIFETAHEGIWVTDAARRTVLVNRRMAEMMREEPEAMIGASALDYVPPERRSDSASGLERRRAGVAERVEVQMMRRDGTILDALVAVSSLLDASGAYQGAVGLVTDVSEQRFVEHQLRQAQRMEAVGKLAGGIAHDFNNILSVVLGLAQLIRDDLPSDHVSQADLVELCAAAERGAKLTRQILAFSRRQVLQPVVLDVNAAISALLPMLHRLLGEQIEIRSFLSRDAGRIRVDAGQFEQVLINLSVNARDAMSEGGRLTFETQNVELDQQYVDGHLDTQTGPYVLIAVSDTGHGMNAATRARAFEPFFTTKEPGRGTGLGLSTVHGIVRQSGGHIWVYSEPGRGTTFKLYFPRTSAAVVALSVDEPAQEASLQLTILLVEDEGALRGVTETVLRRAGHRVLSAASPSLALECSKQFPDAIDLLITDVIMPEMNGQQLARQLNQSRPTMRVLFVSGYTENTIVHDGVLDPGVAYLPKPFTPDQLMRSVRQAMSTRPSQAPGS